MRLIDYFLVVLLNFWCCSVTLATLPVSLSNIVQRGDWIQCPIALVHDAATSILNGNMETIISNTVIPFFRNHSANPYPSCSSIPAGTPSGYYWIQTNTGSPSLEYCDMTRTSCCGTTGGWMRVANLDMTDTNQQCPLGFTLWTSPRRLCGRPGVGCVSTTYPLHGVQYSRVCGRIKGYQYHTPDAFAAVYFDRSLTINQAYVDGVSLTHGQSPRRHIWTFVNAFNEAWHNQHVCPCSRTDVPNPDVVVPSFIGQDYFCDSGTRAIVSSQLFTGDPLWDGHGCGSTSTCCRMNNPPWFCKQLPQPTRDDIELRLCADQDTGDEDIPIEAVELYVQ